MSSSNKLAKLNRLKEVMKEVEWHSTFNFESYEIDEETKVFIEKKEELISNSFKKYSSSKYEICMALMEVKAKLQSKGNSFMAWYTHIGFTKDKVSELIKYHELYSQVPSMKDYISSLSGVAVRLLTHKDVSPQLAVDIMEKGVKNMDDIRELIELSLAPEQPKKVIEYKGTISKKSLGTIRSIERQIKKSSSATELNTVKKEIEAMKKLLSDMEKDIANREKEYENKNNLQLPVDDPTPAVEVEVLDKKVYRDNRGWVFFVRSGLGENTFKAFYAKNVEDFQRNIRCHAVKSLEWRGTENLAQVDLDRYAANKKMEVLRID